MKKIIFILFLFLTTNAHSQTMQVVDGMERRKQGCVEGNEPGRSPVFCIGRFKDQLDSLMQVVLQQLNDRAGDSYKQILRKEQTEWLEKQMDNDKQLDSTKHESMSGAALRVFKYEAKTVFLRDRVKYLLSKL